MLERCFNPHLCRSRDEIKENCCMASEGVSIHISAGAEMKFLRWDGWLYLIWFQSTSLPEQRWNNSRNAVRNCNTRFNPHLCRSRDEIIGTSPIIVPNFVSIHISAGAEMKFHRVRISRRRVGFNPHLCRSRDEISDNRQTPRKARFQSTSLPEQRWNSVCARKDRRSTPFQSTSLPEQRWNFLFRDFVQRFIMVSIHISAGAEMKFGGNLGWALGLSFQSTSLPEQRWNVCPDWVID